MTTTTAELFKNDKAFNGLIDYIYAIKVSKNMDEDMQMEYLYDPENVLLNAGLSQDDLDRIIRAVR